MSTNDQHGSQQRGPGDRRRVLMLTHRVPYPPDRGDRIRAYHLLRGLAGRFDMTLATLADEPVSADTRSELDRLCDEVLIAPVRPMQRRASAARALFTGHAITPAAMYDRDLSRRLVARHRARPFDAVLTYCTGMVGYTRTLLDLQAVPGPRHVLDLVDVDSAKWARYAESTRGPMRLVYAAEARRLRSVEAGRVVPFDAVSVISEAEARVYRMAVTPAHTPAIVRNGVDTDHFHPSQVAGDTPPVLIFTGVMSYKPNIDAVTWFAREVMPRVLAAVPGARFDIVGKSPTPGVIALGELPGVRVVGPVDDTGDCLRESAVAVAPMRIAPGVQNKVLEAMACGLPVVCSSAAASGIDAEHDQHLVIADSPADVAKRCAELLTRADRRSVIGQAARRRVEERYDWAAAVAPMLDLIDPASAEAMRRTHATDTTAQHPYPASA